MRTRPNVCGEYIALCVNSCSLTWEYVVPPQVKGPQRGILGKHRAKCYCARARYPVSGFSVEQSGDLGQREHRTNHGNTTMLAFLTCYWRGSSWSNRLPGPQQRPYPSQSLPPPPLGSAPQLVTTAVERQKVAPPREDLPQNFAGRMPSVDTGDVEPCDTPALAGP